MEWASFLTLFEPAVTALKNTLDTKHVKEIHEAQVQQIVANHPFLFACSCTVVIYLY
jgi:hypothetical protein